MLFNKNNEIHATTAAAAADAVTETLPHFLHWHDKTMVINLLEGAVIISLLAYVYFVSLKLISKLTGFCSGSKINKTA